MKCFYHTDMDGKCAGAIVYKYYVRERNINDVEGCQFIAINYKDEFPFDKILPNELVVIVDFSLQKPGEWQKLFAITQNVIWIDHHKTAIEQFPKEYENCLKGGVQKDGEAGCVLTWKYFYPKVMIPGIVELLGDYDIWAFKFGDDTNFLQTGIWLFKNNPENENWEIWFKNEHLIREIIEKGKICTQYRDMTFGGLIKAWSFFATFEGYKAICCNAGSVSSQLFDSVKEDYDLMMPFVFDGKQWTVSIYTKKDGEGGTMIIDCSALAKKYGGGGHKQAAGFQCKELPFKKAD